MQDNNLVKFGNEALEEFKALVMNDKFSKVFFVVDENTHENCLIPLVRELPELPENEILEVEAGEGSKSTEVLVQLWHAMSELNADRNSLIVNVGGGMVSDLGGFLAGTYMRGVSFVNFPTTVLAQVDASVGGKTGINLDHIKNRVGLFQNPLRTFVINDFLETLPQDERRSGFAEMLKHGLIADKEYWNELKEFDIDERIPDSLMIQKSVEIKSSIVNQDFKEQGIRKALNFGHTVGHALETLALDKGHKLLHGEAIALGMICETHLSIRYAGLKVDEANEIIEVLKKKYSNVEPTGSPEEWVELMKMDKKNVNGEYRFSLIKKLGEAVINVEVKEEDILESLNLILPL